MSNPIEGDTRRYVPELPVTLERRDDGKLELRATTVGLWRDAPADGALVSPGGAIGLLEVLGRRHRLVAPAGAAGLVVERGVNRARTPVGHGDVLLVLDPELAGAAAAGVADATAAVGSDAALVFTSPTSGRFYARPSPDKPPFVSPGDVIEHGQTVALLEVMKTFNRVQYGGATMPARAKVVRIVPDNETDVDGGAVLLELEPA